MKKIALLVINAYQKKLIPFLPRQNVCRFSPTCSVYAYEAIKKHGIIAGGILSLKRIIRCNPRTPMLFDPVPRKNKLIFNK